MSESYYLVEYYDSETNGLVNEVVYDLFQAMQLGYKHLGKIIKVTNRDVYNFGLKHGDYLELREMFDRPVGTID